MPVVIDGKVKWSERYDALFAYWGQVHEVPWKLLKRQAFKESSLNPDAKSSDGGMGLAQFMKLTVPEQFVGGQQDPYDPEEAIRAMARYDAKLHTNIRLWLAGQPEDPVFTWRCALVSYNAGGAYVKRALQIIEDSGTPLTWAEFCATLPKAEVQGKRAKAEVTIPYAEFVVPDAASVGG